ncbi:recombinase family protein [Nonomuraea sp. NPDC046570]|uniref:recombinase family protein n=1 Tax=Nonomuraea sp. NPDC046570 TaxID=3155255 RepID=UPI00340DDC49
MKSSEGSENLRSATTLQHRFLRKPRGGYASGSLRAARRQTGCPSGIKIGYAQVSAGGQNLERQLDALKTARRRRVFAEKKSGVDRAKLATALEFMQLGDPLVAPSLNRLSRSPQELITTVVELRWREIGFTSLHESLDITTPGGCLVFHVFATLAEFIRELIISGTCEDLATARGRGRRCLVGLGAAARATQSRGAHPNPWEYLRARMPVQR